MVEVLEKAELEKYTQAIEKGDFSFLENLSQEKMAALYAKLNENGLNKLSEHLSPKQILDAEALVPSEGKDNFDKLCEMKLQHLAKRGQEVLVAQGNDNQEEAAQGKNNIELATLVEQAPEIEKLSARATNKPETVAEVQKMMGEALAQYDAENGLKNVDAARLDANMQNIESHWDYDPFAPKAEGEKQDPEWEELHNMVKALDVRGKPTTFGREQLDEAKQAESKDTLMEAAKLKAMQKMANKEGGVSAEDWDGSLKESLREVLLEAYSADQMSKGNTNQHKIANGFRNLANVGSKGKKVQINRDSIAGVAAAVYMASSTYSERLGQLSSPTAEGVKKFTAKAKDLDAKWSQKYGENYALAKNGLKQLGMSALGFAKGYALGEAAKLCGPVGMAALAAYRMGTSIKNMSSTYKQMKAQNKDLTFGKFLTSKEGLFGASAVALSAVSAVIPGMSGAENLGQVAQIMRYGQSLAGMGLALGPKIGAVLKSPKGQRKAAVVALGVAATGFLTSCLMRGGSEETTDLKTMAEGTVASNVGLDLNGNGIPDSLEPQQEFRVVPENTNAPQSNFDENDMSSVYGHNPNQAAFERGEFEVENQAAAQQPNHSATQQSEVGAKVSEQGEATPNTPEGAFWEAGGAHSIDMAGAKFDYAIDAKGMIQVQGNVELDHQQDLALAQKMSLSLTPNEYGTYTTRGEYGEVGSGDPSKLVDDIAQYSLQDLKVQEAVYTDLTERQNMGSELSEGEQKFMQGHEADLKKWGLSHEDLGYMGDYAPHEDTPENINLVEGETLTEVHQEKDYDHESMKQPESKEQNGGSVADNSEHNKENDGAVMASEFEPQQIGGVRLTHYAEVDGKIVAHAVITEQNQDLVQAMLDETARQDAENGISGSQAQYHRDLAINDARTLQAQAAVCVYIQQQHPDGNFSEAEAAYMQKTEAQLAKYGFGLDSPSNSAEQQAQSQDVAQTTSHPMQSKIEALRQEMMYNKACNEANAAELTGAERNQFIYNQVHGANNMDDKTYVAQELGGNEAKKNAYQDDIYAPRRTNTRS